jgi:hypothetical protein
MTIVTDVLQRLPQFAVARTRAARRRWVIAAREISGYAYLGSYGTLLLAGNAVAFKLIEVVTPADQF